jgi:hypothetical protein
VGSWVEYEAVNSGTTMDNAGQPVTLRLSVTEKEGEQFWYEVRTVQGDRKDITRFLARPAGTTDLLGVMSPWEKVSRVIVQSDGNTPQEVPATAMDRYVPDLVAAYKMLGSRKVTTAGESVEKKLDAATLEVAGKKLSLDRKTLTRTDESQVNLGFIKIDEKMEYTVTVGRNEKIPVTGVGRYEAKVVLTSSSTQPGKETTSRPSQNMTSKLVLKGFGTSGAKSELKGTPVMMKENPFPFLPVAPAQQ